MKFVIGGNRRISAQLRMIFLLCDFPLHAGCTAGGQKTSCSEKTTKPNRWKSVRPRSRLRKTRDAGIYCRIRLIVCRPRSPMTGRAFFFKKFFPGGRQVLGAPLQTFRRSRHFAANRGNALFNAGLDLADIVPPQMELRDGLVQRVPFLDIEAVHGAIAV